ncbi:alpha/beta hydrolase-fold protein [Pelomonas sp. SE-A7]|uniref:alpha/beta hydrolase n=1 Tax=Pelomonas sp. SE-A7 TaxID=3054953 RepID=UPI00259C6B9E|nr:alpha/beta hydrolase-fold protein [Pelomonas sp. SE-A7]MDM4766013.1 alpha/beta hydrolase-fold protein [Pelomonas sp. SE-A7]
MLLSKLLRILASFACIAALSLPGLAWAGHRVDFEIDLRAEIAAGRFDPARDQVGLRGSVAPLSWGRTLPAKPAAQGLYKLGVVFEQIPFGGQPLQYKFKIDRPGATPDNGWEDGRNHSLGFPSEQQQVARAFNAEPAKLPAQRTGQIDRLPPIASSHVSPRGLQVWLPPGYEREPQRRYPVLYLHDGQNVFDADAAGAEWQVDETAQRLVLAGAIEPVIIVAVDSNSRDRFLDYTPTEMLIPAARSGRDKDERQGGGGPRYARYLVEDLKPFIDQRYRTRPEPASTAVGGSSLGGLISMWLLLHHGDTFGAGLVVSPSVWWDDMFLLRDVRTTAPVGTARPRAWLDMGDHEGPGALVAARQLRDALLARGWQSGGTLGYMEQAGAGHDEAAWASRVEPMLRYLYGSKDVRR